MNHQNHNNHNDHHNPEEKKGHNHGLMMLLCLVPLIAFLALPRMGIELGSMGRYLPYAIFLICPLMHIGMMFMMRDHGKDGNQQQVETDQRQIQD